MHTKRLVAYIIDIVIITVFLAVLFSFLPMSEKRKKIQVKIDTLGSEYALGNVEKMDYFMELSKLEKQLDKEQALEIVIDSVAIVIYFIILPCLMKGVTLGKKVMHLRVVSKTGKRANLMELFIRAFFVDGLLASLLLIFGLYVIPSDFYLSFTSILAVLQLLTLTISFFMIKYRGDFMGIEDILSNSKVIKTEGVDA